MRSDHLVESPCKQNDLNWVFGQNKEVQCYKRLLLEWGS